MNLSFSMKSVEKRASLFPAACIKNMKKWPDYCEVKLTLLKIRENGNGLSP